MSDPARHWAEVLATTARRPLDVWTVAALLEAEGLRDQDARERFGCPDLFAFAEQVFHALPRWRPSSMPPRDGVVRPWLAFVGRLLRGSFFAWPMLAQLAVGFATRHWLVGSFDYDESQATAVGLAMIASLVATGAMVMTIGRQAHVLDPARDGARLREVLGDLLRVGFALGAACVATAVALQLLFEPLPWRLFALALAYFISLGWLWVSVAAMQALAMRVQALALTTLGAIAVGALVRFEGASVHGAQLGMILTVALAALLLVARRLGPPPPGSAARSRARRLDVILGSNLTFIVYGLGYFLLIFLDRAMVWTAPAHAAPALLRFHAGYELGAEWALASFVLPMSLLEHFVHAFNERLESLQHGLKVGQRGDFRAAMKRFGARSFALLTTVSAANLSLAWAVPRHLAARGLAHRLAASVLDPAVARTFLWLGAGFQVLSWGLLLSLWFFTLARGEAVLRALWPAVGTAAVVGYVASRLWAPEAAAAGMTAGAVVFTAGMMMRARRFFARIDHRYYAAY